MARLPRLTTSAAIVTLVLIPQFVAADGNFNCKHGIVSVGDSSYIVAKKCGEPDGKEDIAGGGAKVTQENWYYGGGSQLNYRFVFRGGSLVEIEHVGN